MTTDCGPPGRPRTIGAVAGLLAVLMVLLAVDTAIAPGAFAVEPPIPGSPLDAYDRGIPYDTGVHSIARLAAIIAYALMVATVVLGALLRLRLMQRTVNRATVYGAHMTLALSALIFGGIHGVTFLYQPIWDIGLHELVIPFSGGRQRLPVGYGILGTELGIAVGCSIWLQQRLGYHRWLRFHQLAYAAFGLVWLHVFTVHPEPRHLNPVAVGIAAGAGACLFAFLIRILPSRSRLRARRPFAVDGGGSL